MSANYENDPEVDEDYNYIFGPLEIAAAQSSSESWRGSSPDLPSQGDDNDDNDEELADEEDLESANDLIEDEGTEEGSEDEARKGGESHEKGRRNIYPEAVLRKNQRYYLTGDAVKAYRSLLNDMHIDADYEPNTPFGDLSLVNTKLGLVQWTNGEEARLFTALARKGKNGVREIAQEVQSKSQLEVQEYIRTLQSAVEDISKENPNDLIRASDIPAAVEISEEAEKVFDRFAEHVSILSQTSDAVEGRAKYGQDFWLIDSKTADKIEQTSKPDDIDSPQSSIFHLAEFFHMKQWIQLSERLFMNSGNSRFEENWRSVAFRNESPSITADAFAEFYIHAVSITQHLVKVSLLLAQDRLARVLNVNHEGRVRKVDVLKALSILNMKPNAFDHFIGVARRFQLDVAEISNKRFKKNRYVSYDEVEKTLSQQRRFNSDSRKRISSRGKTTEEDSDDLDDEDEYDAYSSLGISDDDDEEEGDREETEADEHEHTTADENDQVHLSATENMNQPSEMELADEAGSDYDLTIERRLARDEKRIDEYMDFVDKEASKDAEIALRQMLKCPGIDRLPSIVKAEQELIEIPPTVTAKRKGDDPPDWRDEIVYQAEWEAFGAGVSEIDKAIARNHEKRRRTE